MRISDFVDNAIKLSRPGTAPNVSGSKGSLFVFEEEATSGGFGKKFESTHFVRTENAVFAVLSELFEMLPAKGGFTGGWSCADDVKPWTEKLLFVNIFKTGEPTGIIFKRVNVSFKLVGEIVRNVRRFRRKSGVVPAGNMT